MNCSFSTYTDPTSLHASRHFDYFRSIVCYIRLRKHFLLNLAADRQFHARSTSNGVRAPGTRHGQRPGDAADAIVDHVVSRSRKTAWNGERSIDVVNISHDASLAMGKFVYVVETLLACVGLWFAQRS